MKSCTIIISHFESPQFLRACIRQIRLHRHLLVEQKIIIADQSCDKTYDDIYNEYFGSDDVSIVRTRPLYSGFGLDWIFRNVEIKTEYVCQLHVDAFPISSKWLLMPIKLIEESKLYFVGQLQFIADGTASIYPPDKFFAMAQCYNVAKTSTYRELSMMAGFTRFHNRPMSGINNWASGDWRNWAAADYERRGSDDDVVAFHWEDKHRQHDKLGLAITGYIEPSYGRIIEDVVFHFGSCREALGVLDQMPKQYVHYLNRITENYSDELIAEMVAKAKDNRPPELEILSRNLWNGTTKESYPTNSVMNAKIEELKK